VGPAVAFLLPLVFSIAYFPGWRQPLLVVALYGTLEAVANSFLEPVVYGRTTGVSALGLLVAAMFWTWLWGGLGLLLSTPMTVCLAVLGKYVPGLGFLATLLGEETALEPDVRFYQRLLAGDQDGAVAILDAALKGHPRADVFDQVLIPALSRAERDRSSDDIDETELTFIWRVVGELLDDLEETTPAAEPEPEKADSALTVLGIASNDQGDVLALRMLGQLLPRSQCTLTIMGPPESPLKLGEKVSDSRADLIVVSHLPPVGATTARYLVRRLRARFALLPILVGRWRDRGDAAEVVERLKGVGATCVALRLAEARDVIVEKYLTAPAAPSTAGELAPAVT
jgi:hypothetical protein